jgi:WD40 repeat protein
MEVDSQIDTPSGSGPFISYSRKDREFVQRLHGALARRERDAWVDWEDIPPLEEWFAKIKAAINAAPAFVFLISPDSASSQVCLDEINHAVAQNKRLIPILYREVHADQVHEALRKINWIHLRDEDDFEQRIDELVKAMDLDLEWVRAHTRLLVRSEEWKNERRDGSFLMRGKDLKEAERWLLIAGQDSRRQLTSAQTEYIVACRQAEDRRRNVFLAATTTALLVAIGLTLFAWMQKNVADIQRRRAEHEARIALSRQLAAQAISTSDPRQGLLLAIEGTRTYDTTESRVALAEVMQRTRHLDRSLYYPHRRNVTALAFGPSGDTLYARSSEADVERWSLIGDDALPAIGLAELRAGPGWSLAHLEVSGQSVLSPDGRTMAAIRKEGNLELSTKAGNKAIATVLDGHEGRVSALAFSPDGALFASASSGKYRHKLSFRDSAIRLWQVAEGLPLKFEFVLPEGERNGRVGISADGKVLANGSRSVWIWDAVSGRQLCPPLEQHSEAIRAVALTRDGSLLASASLDHTIRLWTVATCSPLGSSLTGHTGGVQALAFSPDGTQLASGSEDRTVRLWDVHSQRPIEIFRGHDHMIRSVAYSPDGTVLVSGANDKTYRLWDTVKRTAVGSSCDATDGGAVMSVSFTSKSTLVTGGADRVVRVWDAPRCVQTRTPLLGHTGTIWSLATDAAGSLLATGSGSQERDDNTVAVWDLTAGQRIAVLHGHTRDVRSVALSGDGKLLVSADDGRIVRVWNLDREDWIKVACRRASLNFFKDEWQRYMGDQSYRKTCASYAGVSDPSWPYSKDLSEASGRSDGQSSP